MSQNNYSIVLWLMDNPEDVMSEFWTRYILVTQITALIYYGFDRLLNRTKMLLVDERPVLFLKHAKNKAIKLDSSILQIQICIFTWQIYFTWKLKMKRIIEDSLVDIHVMWWYTSLSWIIMSENETLIDFHLIQSKLKIKSGDNYVRRFVGLSVSV